MLNTQKMASSWSAMQQNIKERIEAAERVLKSVSDEGGGNSMILYDELKSNLLVLVGHTGGKSSQALSVMVSSYVVSSLQVSLATTLRHRDLVLNGQTVQNYRHFSKQSGGCLTPFSEEISFQIKKFNSPS